VAVLTNGNKVNIRPVEVGSRIGQMWVINKGLNPGEKVVSEGTSKVREGATVNPTVEEAANGTNDSGSAGR
jgi:membrane fusion protein (multidrug efflux system)